MKEEELEYLLNTLYEQERERINNAHWADLTLDEMELIEDKKKKVEYKKEQRKFHIHIINPLANSVPRKFKFSVPDESLTYRIMMNDYMKFFYGKGMTRDQIIEMMIKNRTIVSRRKNK